MALHQVYREPDPDPEAVDWAADELLAGQDFPDVEAELVGQGWTPSEAQATVEAARVRTRRDRGVVTRDDVAQQLAVDYHRHTAGMSVFRRSGIGLFSIFAFLTAFRASLATARRLKRIGQRRDRAG